MPKIAWLCYKQQFGICVRAWTVFLKGRHLMKKTKMQKKIGTVMGEFKRGTLHSGKGGPVVKNRKQAVAIAMSEGRKASRKRK